MILFLSLLLAAAAPQKLPPANALPPPASEEGAALATVNKLFDAMARHDAAALRVLIRPNATITVADALPDGTHKLTTIPFEAFITRLSTTTDTLDERMISPAVEIDGDIAMVWGFYTFRLNGKFTHCGVDHFSLVRENGNWKIANLSFSTRETDCGL